MPYKEATNVDALAEHFEVNLKLCLDIHAPLVEKRIVPRRKE